MELDKFIDLVDVENNSAFQPRSGETFCNCYAKVVLASQGVYIPNMVVNDLYAWLWEKDYKNWTWFRFDSTRPVVDLEIAIATRNPHGHIAVHRNDGFWTWAGAHNKNRGTIEQSFGTTNDVKFLQRVK